jgi:hypothetical protein
MPVTQLLNAQQRDLWLQSSAHGVWLLAADADTDTVVKKR